MCSSRSIGISYETTIAPRQRVSRTVLYPTHNDCQVLRLLGKASLAASSCCSISDRASDAAVGIQPLGRHAGVWLRIHWTISPRREREVACIPDPAMDSDRGDPGRCQRMPLRAKLACSSLHRRVSDTAAHLTV